MTVDSELRAVAVRSADRYPDSLLAAQGWTRDELVAAILQRLRRKYHDARTDGALVIDPAGVVRQADACPTPLKRRYRNEHHARRHTHRNAQQRRRDAERERRTGQPTAELYPYECPIGGHWHLTHHTPDVQQRYVEPATRQKGRSDG